MTFLSKYFRYSGNSSCFSVLNQFNKGWCHFLCIYCHAEVFFTHGYHSVRTSQHSIAPCHSFVNLSLFHPQPELLRMQLALIIKNTLKKHKLFTMIGSEFHWQGSQEM